MDNELVSFTTRPMRLGEVNGIDYHFISKQEYNDMLKNNQFIERTKYGGNYYGISKKELYSKLEKDDAYCIVDFNGVKQMKHTCNNCTTVFIHTPKEQAINQMLQRGDTVETVKQRMKTFNKERANKWYYDYAVINRSDELLRTKSIIDTIVQTESTVTQKTN